MKITLRVPVKEQYAYMELEMDIAPNGIADAIETYMKMTKLYWTKQKIQDEEDKKNEVPF